jgi:hypothetical protein
MEERDKDNKIKGLFGVEFLWNFPRTQYCERVTRNEILFVYFKIL